MRPDTMGDRTSSHTSQVCVVKSKLGKLEGGVVGVGGGEAGIATGGMLICWGCWNKVLQTARFTQRIFIVSRFQRTGLGN